MRLPFETEIYRLYEPKNGELRPQPTETLEQLCYKYDKALRDLEEYRKSELRAASKYILQQWIGGTEPEIMEDTDRNYAHRTRTNAAWSDITLAVAVDMKSPGEITTKKAAGKKYVGYELIKSMSAPLAYPMMVAACAIDICDKLYMHPDFRAGIKLNIAGNSHIAFKQVGISTHHLQELFRQVLSTLVSSGMAPSEVRSGGQTGADEAAIKAAQSLGLKCSILAPKDYRMHYEKGFEIENKECFINRFREYTVDYSQWKTSAPSEFKQWQSRRPDLSKIKFDIDLKTFYELSEE